MVGIEDDHGSPALAAFGDGGDNFGIGGTPLVKMDARMGPSFGVDMFQGDVAGMNFAAPQQIEHAGQIITASPITDAGFHNHFRADAEQDFLVDPQIEGAFEDFHAQPGHAGEQRRIGRTTVIELIEIPNQLGLRSFLPSAL